MDADEYGPTRPHSPFEETVEPEVEPEVEPDLCTCGELLDRLGSCPRCPVAGDGRLAVRFFEAEQADKDARLAGQGFTGVDCDLVTGRWLLWIAGRVIGQVDDARLASRLRPVLADAAREAA